MPKREGFPEPLFETPDDLVDLAVGAEKVRSDVETVLAYLLGVGAVRPSLGRLREADQILGDITVYAQDVIDEIRDRLTQLGLGAKPEVEKPEIKNVGGVPLDQA